jgi:folate-dependent phosphoribosylglycinamide formyltransferase PurN
MSLSDPSARRAEVSTPAARRARVVLLSCDGLFQRYLACRLASQFDLAGVVIQVSPKQKGSLAGRLLRYVNPILLWEYVQARVLNRIEEDRAAGLVRELFFSDGKEPQIPGNVPVISDADVNSPAVVEFVTRLEPDVICVNGTNLLRAPMLGLRPRLRHGIINLHTGLSPYSRGGNCNMFMLLEGHPELVGLTVHYIDEGIDSGDIIVTARPAMNPDDNFYQLEAKVFRLGIDLMLACVDQAAKGHAPREKQWTKGKLFLLRTGYRFKPFQIVQVNRLLKRGLLQDYLQHQAERSADVRLVQPVEFGDIDWELSPGQGVAGKSAAE